MATRARASNATPGPSSQAFTSISAKLPDYEPPQFAMNADAQRALAGLYQKHNFEKLEKDLAAAIRTITESVADINERLTERTYKLDQQKSRKRKNTSQDSAEEQDADEQDEESQRELQAFKEKVEGMTKRMDEGVRKMIDGQQALDSTRQALTAAMHDAREHATTQATMDPSRARPQHEGQPGQDGDDEMADDGEEPDYPDITPTGLEQATQSITGPSTFFKDKAEEWRRQYRDRSLVDRYAGHNDYKNFRGLLHDAQHPDESVPLPRPDTWFDEGTLARPGETQRAQDDDDEDIQISRTTTSTKCPITLREFVEPLTSRKCAHTFEAQPIREMIQKSKSRIDGRPGPRDTIIGGRPAVRCPVASCEQMLEQADLYVDAAIIRRIRRLQQREDELTTEDRHDHDATVIDDDEDDDGPDIDELERDDIVPSSLPVKKEALSGRMR